MSLYDFVLILHILAGTAALATFWTAAFLRKGSGRHKQVGRIYMIAMLAVLVSALPLAAAAFGRQQPVLGTFLLYLVLITATACWTAWRAVKDKNDIARYTGPLFRALAWANLAAGAVVLALGLRYGQVILTGLALVGLITGPAMLRFAARRPAGRGWWLPEHYEAIIGCGVATHIAFLNLGVSRLVPPEWGGTAMRFAWFAPLALAIVARIWLGRRYGRKVASSSRPAPVTSGAV